MKRACFLILITISFMFPMLANASSIGIGLGWTDSPYKGYGSDYYPVPHINYDNDTIYVDNISAGIYIYNDNTQDLSFGVHYLSTEFKPKNSNNEQLQYLNKRNSTLLAEMEYSIVTPWGGLSTSIGTDVLNTSNSILINADYTLAFMGEKWIVMPQVGLNWANHRHNDYYYGVSQKEASRSGLAYHKANSSFTPYIDLTGQYTLITNFNAFAGIHIDKLTGDAANSPIIAHSTIISAFTGISYSF